MNAQRLLVILSVAVFLAAAAGASARQQTRLALVIGNADYTNAPALRDPSHDAEAMTAKLAQLGFKVITVVNGTYRQMVSAEDKFANELNGYDVGLFYFSGHGVQYKGGNYLIPVNANIRRAIDIQFEALNAAQVLDDMESSGAQVNIMLLDACRSNPFASGFQSTRRGLSLMRAPAGSVVVYSTAPDQVASGVTGQESPFTAALLANVEMPGVSIQDMLTSVFRQVQQETHGAQVPWESSSVTIPFYFAPTAPAAASIAPTPQQPRVTQESPNQPSSAAAIASPAPETSTGQLVIDIKTAVPNAATASITLSGPNGSRSLQAEPNLPYTLSLAPGTYQVTATLFGDAGVGYRGAVLVPGGEQTTLEIPLDYSLGYRINLLQQQRAVTEAEAIHTDQERQKLSGRAALLTLFGFAGGAAAYLGYLGGASAYTAYQGASSATEAQSDRSQVIAYGTASIGSAIGGLLLLISGLVTIAHRPSKSVISDLQGSVTKLDIQIQALRAEESLGR